MKITSDGLKMIAMIFVSCNPIHNGVEDELQGQFVNAQGLSENQLYLIGAVNSGKDYDFDEYVSKLPNSGSLYKYEKIRNFALANNYDEISEELVLKFFGGEQHIAKALADNLQVKVNGTEFGKRLLFMHLVMPVRITELHGDLFGGVYENGELVVRLKGLVPLMKFIPVFNEVKLNVGDIVLVHYASIISQNASTEIIKYLHSEQSKSSEYANACRDINEMDFEKFWNISEWTKKIANA